MVELISPASIDLKGPLSPFTEKTMHKLVLRTAKYLSIDSEKGVTAIEYGLIASLVAVAIIVSVTLVGTNLAATFNYIAGKITTP
jgi:pilus assembly protein Flp/PilA